MTEQEPRTEIGALGEFGLIKVLTSRFKDKQDNTLKGIGDDAAVLKYNDTCIVVTTDMLVEGIHFDLMYVPLKHLGYKAVVVNLSDVFAMNAQPKQITVSMAISNRFSVEALEEIYEGIRHACDVFEVDLVGGDITSSTSGLVLSITAIGEAKETELVYRSGAKPGDVICVSGDLGAAYLGLQLMEREKQIFLESPEVQPTLDDQKYLVGRQLKPQPRKDIIAVLQEHGIKPTSMIDVSDGLSSELLHICDSSNVGAKIYEDSIPIHEDAYHLAIKFGLDPVTCAMSGGEDYELLFTVSAADSKKLSTQWDISTLGYITEPGEGVKLITKQQNEYDITAQGWDALLKAKKRG